MGNLSNELPSFGFQEPANLFAYVEAFSHDEGFEPKTSPQPTSFPPGSREKVNVLAQRVLDNEQLWHEDDVVVDLEVSRLMELFGVKQ